MNMEPTIIENNGVSATFSDGTTAHRDRLREYGYDFSLQPSAFKNIFAISKTKTEICAILRDPSAVMIASNADGVPIGTNLTHPKIGVGDKGFDRKKP
jgi:hypothetical protein